VNYFKGWCDDASDRGRFNDRGAIYANDRVRFMRATGTATRADGDKRRALFNHIMMAD